MAFPTVEIVAPRTPQQYVVIVIVMAGGFGLVVGLIVLSGVVSGRWSAVTGNLVALAVLATLVSLFFWLSAPALLRRNARARERLLTRCPPGTLFVGQAAKLRQTGLAAGLPPFGLLCVTNDGMSFVAGKDPAQAPQMVITWSEMASLKLAPRTAATASVKIVLTSGAVLIGAVSGIEEMGKAIREVQGRSDVEY